MPTYSDPVPLPVVTDAVRARALGAARKMFVPVVLETVPENPVLFALRITSRDVMFPALKVLVSVTPVPVMAPPKTTTAVGKSVLSIVVLALKLTGA
jgi:hypothetical protein